MPEDKIHGFYAPEVHRIARAVRHVERSPGVVGGGDDQSHDGPNVQVVYVKTVATAGRRKYKGEFLRSPQTFVNFYNLQETSGGATDFAVGDYVWITTTDFDYLKPLVNEELAAGDNWATAAGAMPLSGLRIKQINSGTPDVVGVRILKVITSDPTVVGRGELDVVDEPNGTDLETVSIRTRVPVIKNSSGFEFIRRRVSFVEGSNITLTFADGGANDGGAGDQTTITIDAAGGGSMLWEYEDGTGDVASVTTTRLDNEDFTLSSPGAGIALIATAGITATSAHYVVTEANHGLIKAGTSVTPVADGTYTVGDKITVKGNNGVITFQLGLATFVQEAT